MHEEAAIKPAVEGILESSLYVEDLDRSLSFYQTLFGFETLFRSERACAMSVASRHVFLLFQRGGSTSPTTLPGGTIPPHDGSGNLHMAFAITEESVESWKAWLIENGVKIESIVRWKLGGRSLYFRDPDHHLIELVAPGTWAIY
jgi:catechol 2,3-dioxygenase-like lactoylglutathione lyase family enzyme